MVIKAVEPSQRQNGPKYRTRVLSATGHRLVDAEDGYLPKVSGKRMNRNAHTLAAIERCSESTYGNQQRALSFDK